MTESNKRHKFYQNYGFLFAKIDKFRIRTTNNKIKFKKLSTRRAFQPHTFHPQKLKTAHFLEIPLIYDIVLIELMPLIRLCHKK